MNGSSLMQGVLGGVAECFVGGKSSLLQGIQPHAGGREIDTSPSPLEPKTYDAKSSAKARAHGLSRMISLLSSINSTPPANNPLP